MSMETDPPLTDASAALVALDAEHRMLLRHGEIKAEQAKIAAELAHVEAGIRSYAPAALSRWIRNTKGLIVGLYYASADRAGRISLALHATLNTKDDHVLAALHRYACGATSLSVIDDAVTVKLDIRSVGHDGNTDIALWIAARSDLRDIPYEDAGKTGAHASILRDYADRRGWIVDAKAFLATRRDIEKRHAAAMAPINAASGPFFEAILSASAPSKT